MPTQDELLLKLIYQEENKAALKSATEQLEKMSDEEKKLIKTNADLAASAIKTGEAQAASAKKATDAAVAQHEAHIESIKKLNMVIGGALVAGLTAAAAASIKLGMDMEQTKVAFTTLTGSAAEAQKHLDDLRDFAASTPFQFTELTAASKKMMAFGFETERIVPMLRDIGDATSALGLGSEGIDRITRALGQMQAKGKVTGEEMMQLTEAGLPGWKYLADAMGKTTAEVMKMSSQGLIPAGKAIDALLAGMRNDFGGMMAKQSETAAGQLSNLVDSLESIGTSIGTIALPAIKALIKGLQEFARIAKEAVATADILTNGQNKIAEAFDGTARKMREAVIAGTMTTKDYNDALQGMAASISYLPPAGQAALVSMYALNDAQIAAMTGAYGLNGALDETNRATARLAVSTTDAAAATEAQSKILGPTELAMRALAQANQEGGTATKTWEGFLKDEAKAQEESVRAMQKGRDEVVNYTASYNDLAKSLVGATEAMAKKALAEAAIKGLEEAAKNGTISQSDMAKAIDTVMLKYDMATPKTLAMRDAQKAVTEAFESGHLPIANYIAASERIPKIAEDGKLSLEELRSLGLSPVTAAVADQEKSVMTLRDAWLKIPTNVKTIYTIETKGEAPSGAPATLPKGAGHYAGANFIVPPGYANDTYPLRASSGERVMIEPRNVNNSVTNNWNVNADQAGMALLLERQRMMNSQQFEMRM